MWLKDIKIGTKLMGGFVLVLALAALQSLLAVFGTHTLNRNTGELAEHWLPASTASGAIGTQISQLRATQFQYLLSFGEDERRALEKQMDERRQRMDQELQQFEGLALEASERQHLQALQGQWKQYQAHAAEIVTLARQRRDEEAMDILKGVGLQTFTALENELRALTRLAREGASRSRDTNAALQSVVVWVNLGALALTVVLGLWIARTLTRAISGGVRYAATLTRKVAQGDLSSVINPNTQDEIGHLLHALRDMQNQLAALVTRVRQGAQHVSTASAEIAQGNQDLSARTESQASALEETAASMEELGSTVKQNADNARQANQLAQNATAVAARGGEVVAQMVHTMQGINEASRKIHDIIGVIDGIAFQTNILALNAAVEAARAGEQGRGFAVVAGEVRHLAQRSAAAAKEIKALITDSVGRVEQGSTLAEQAGATMQEVVAAIRRVTDIMAEISAASSEQSAGVAQVGEAITQMDQTTQQNAALVEEMAAAAASLNTQAQELVQAVGVFRLAGDAPTLSAPPAPQAQTLPHARPVAGPARAAAAPVAASPSRAAAEGEWESF
ncbi:MAG: methyl-accepting chemotaxis protein [Hylemonella sp.]